MEHVRGAPYHPQNSGKDRALAPDLEGNDSARQLLPARDLERQIDAFVEHYNHVRYHESLNNLTPADVYFGRAETIPGRARRIKREPSQTGRLQHQLQAAKL